MMRSWRLSLLLLSALTLHSCLSQSPGRGIQEETWIIEAVKRFNLEENVPYLYKPLDDAPSALLEEETDSQSLRIIIKETVCPKSARRKLALCNYQKYGKVKTCTLRLAEKDKDDIKCSDQATTSGNGGGGFPGFNSHIQNVPNLDE